jgi:hypothetical protein
MPNTSQETTMTTMDKARKITQYVLLHKSNGLTNDQAIDHVANGLHTSRDTIITAIAYFLCDGNGPA